MQSAPSSGSTPSHTASSFRIQSFEGLNFLAQHIPAAIDHARERGNQHLNNTLKPNLVRPLIDDFWNHKNLLFAGAIGVLLYFRYIPKVEWISRFALATYIGYFVGITMVQKLQGQVLPQMKSAIRPMNALDLISLDNLIYFVGVLTVLIYFFFSKKHEGAYGRVANVGIWFLMVSFGAAFGYTVMGRVSLLIGRFDFLVNIWLRPMFH